MNNIQPNWPAPSNVHGFTTTRIGGFSKGSYLSFNIAMHVNDNPEDVLKNRAILRRELPGEPAWLTQNHTTILVEAKQFAQPPVADASFTRQAHQVCLVMTADCLPILICDKKGTVVSAIHAGWKGLAAGILPQTLDALQIPPEETLIWLGPAIGPTKFELREDVRDAFLSNKMAQEKHFKVYQDRFLGDIFAMARYQCEERGIDTVFSSDLCTVSDPEHFYSFRRDGETGRMATLIWMD